jgi:hypothetical protein
LCASDINTSSRVLIYTSPAAHGDHAWQSLLHYSLTQRVCSFCKGTALAAVCVGCPASSHMHCLFLSNAKMLRQARSLEHTHTTHSLHTYTSFTMMKHTGRPVRLGTHAHNALIAHVCFSHNDETHRQARSTWNTAKNANSCSSP